MTISRKIADHIAVTTYEQIPAETIQVAKKSLLDTIGVILAANRLGDGCEPLVRFAVSGGGAPESTILGYALRVPAPMAAFANGAMSHALDFEDTHDDAFVHSNAASIPAALAVAEAVGGVSGREFLTAITLGSELVCRMGLSLEEDLLQHGWYMPPVFSAYGATASAAKLLNLTAEQVLDAFSLTMCQATCSAELTNNPQSVIRSVRDCFAAKAGVVSALLAREGVSGFTEPFEGKRGFFHAFARGRYNPETLTKELGERYEAARISFKLWPSCRGTHPYIEGVQNIMRKHGLKPEQIASIKAVVSKVNQMLCEPLAAKKAPATPINAKFSIPFVIATTVHYGDVTLDHFTEEALGNRQVLETAQKVSYEVDEKLSFKETLHGTVIIEAGGQIFTEKVETPFGHPDHPVSDELLVGKFLSCAQHTAVPVPESNLRRAADMILNLEQVGDMRELTALFHPAG